MLRNRVIIIGLLLLLLPIVAKAEDVYYGVPSLKMVDCVPNYQDYLYAEDVVYENGKYKLSDDNFLDRAINLGTDVDDNKEYYSCLSETETECEEVYIVYADRSCMSFWLSDNKLGIRLRNGLKKEDVEYYYVGNDFKEENGQYSLVDYEKYEIRNIGAENHMSTHHELKYICTDNYGITCDHMAILKVCGNNYSYAEPVEDYYLVSDEYIKEDGIFRLVDPYRVMPGAFDDLTGYTCRTKGDTCESLYTVSISGSFDVHDGGRLNRFTLLGELKEKELNLKLNEKYEIKEFFTDEEISKIVVTNPEVAGVSENGLILYKVGETDLIYEDDFNYKVIHLIVTEDMLNPNTNDALFILIGIFAISFVVVYLLKRKEKQLI